MTRKLSFFVVGTQKGGTTALYRMLSHHPELDLSRRKELHFFDDEKRNWPDADYRELRAYSKNGLKCGDFTPIYMYWPNSISRIHSYNKDAKIIILLRNPLYRAFSHWSMERARGYDHLSFADAVSPMGRYRVERSTNGVHRVYSYVERGLYSAQFRNIYRHFSRKDVLVARTDSLYADPTSNLAAICRHIGIGEVPLPRTGYVSPISIPAGIEWRAEFEQNRERLFDIFIEDLQSLRTILDIDISDWLDPSHVEKF